MSSFALNLKRVYYYNFIIIIISWLETLTTLDQLQHIAQFLLKTGFNSVWRQYINVDAVKILQKLAILIQLLKLFSFCFLLILVLPVPIVITLHYWSLSLVT